MLRSLAVSALLICPTAATAALQKTASGCAPVRFAAEVSAGEAYTTHISPALDFKLEAVPAGWMIRILPRSGPRPPHDAAELANPPYLSPSPLLVSTDFAFRAQDAIAWNPRTFRFLTEPAQVHAAEAAFQAVRREPNRPRAGAALYPLLAGSAEGMLRIVDAQISGGTANQTAAAAVVATHFQQTAHSVRADLPPTPLGAILQLRFEVTISSRGLMPGCP